MHIMSGEATNEIYIFSFHKMKKMAYSFQKNEISFYYIQFEARQIFFN